MIRLRHLLLFSLSLCATAAEVLASPEAEFAQCVACHGVQGQGNVALGAPNLSGQSAEYVTRQLLQFRAAQRGSADAQGSQMQAMAQGLNDDQVTRLAQYIATLPVSLPEVEAPTEADLAQGASYYQAKCGGCHGGKAQGNPVFQAPRLAGLELSYLERQYTHFLEGTRGSDDRYGKQMQFMAKTMTDKTLQRDVFAYILSQTAP